MRNLYVVLCGLLIVASAMIFAGCEKDNSTIGEYNQEQELYDWNEFFQSQNAGFVNRVVIVDSVGHTNPVHDTADMKVGDELWKHKHSYSINLAIIHNSLIKLPRNHIDTDQLIEVIHYSIDHQWPISIDIYQGVIMRATILTEEQVNYRKQSSDGKSFYEQIRMQQYLVPLDEEKR